MGKEIREKSWIEYDKPDENTMRHEFNLYDDSGLSIGKARLEYLSYPVRMYLITWTEVGKGFRWQGNGRLIFEKLKLFLEKKKLPCVLFSLYSAEDFYEKMGFIKHKNNMYTYGNISEYEKDLAFQKLGFKLKAYTS